MAHFESVQWLPIPLPKVFAFFSDPRNLPRIMPPEMKVHTELTRLVAPAPGNGEIFSALELDKVAAAGSEFVFSFRPLPLLRMEWHARIEEWVPGRYFRDTQVRGPMQSWSHRHEFAAEQRDGVEGTLICDRINFDIGYGWAGRLVERYLVLPAMQKSFQHRQAQVERALQSR